ncbi:GNAT family N-acetyltransferase [uncultured Tateyamaria sp.]|uniref:GNAT family N-acetyltransferase n=1 Tax=uncultured Tateyamaria sp. TaxID=455651 RepID=UPI0026053724|nr:GNAT family N-acetyltransferase [uncultured Tateyamaria sp.]
MNAPHLRAARSTDAGKVGGILSEFIDTTDWMPRIHTRAEDIGFAGHMIDQGWVRVAETETGIAGFSACENEEVHALYVARHARRGGIGSALLDALKTQCKRLDLWTFQANADAQVFYLHHGFEVVEETDGARNDEGLPDMRFEWKRETL